MSEELTHSPASDPSDSLASWYEQYMAVDADLISSDHVVIQALESDQLDYDQIELEVQRLVPDADVLGGFCGKCRWLLGHWPGIDESDRACPLGRAVNTLDIEAAAKAGCKFCLYLLSGLMSGSPLGMRAAQLDTIRKIEMRFNLRGKDGTSTIAIKNSALIDYQFLWLNLPGKTATKFTKFGANGARMSGCNAVIERMSPICKSHVVGMPLLDWILTP